MSEKPLSNMLERYILIEIDTLSKLALGLHIIGSLQEPLNEETKEKIRQVAQDLLEYIDRNSPNASSGT